MKSLFFSSIVAVVIFAFAFILIMAMATAAVMPIVNAEEAIRISSIGDSDIGKEVTVSGVIVAVSNNIEPSTSATGGGIQTYEPGDTGVLTIDDITGRIFICSDPGLLEETYRGQSITVTGVYAGKDGITETKGIIYADAVSTDIEGGYKDITIKELKEFPEYYYSKQVRIKGTVTRIEIISGKTELEIDDGSGTMNVEYRAEMEDTKIGDEVAVEGKFYRNKIYAFTVRAMVQKPEPEPEKTPEPGPSPIPTPTPAPAPAPTPTPSPTPVEAGGVSIGVFHLPLYLVVIIIAVAAVAGVFIAFKVRKWLMLKRYGG